jgi:methionyl-tRNA synthetase
VASTFYVTTPIYYVNDVPHIGHAYTTVAADALARWRRLCGEEVCFATGCDAHGLKIQRAAAERGVDPATWANRTAQAFRDAWSLLEITNTDFIITTEERHHRAVQQFLEAVRANGYIELGTYRGLYCVACEAYFTPDDLVEGTCPIHRSPVEEVEEENYFFQLSRFTERLLAHYDANPGAVAPPSRRNEVLGFIRSGLQDFSISRTSITWGIPIPWDPAHVTYVWFDALVNYCTVAGYGTDPDRFARWWPADVHLIGKDILRFHAVYWPAMLMAADLAPPRQVFAHGFLLVGGEKMSKTRLNQIAPADLVATFGVDGYRWHFLADQRFGPDGDFSYEAMVARYNSDLANGLGNLAARVLNMATSYLAGRAPGHREDGPLAERAAATAEAAAAAFAALDFAGACFAVQELVRAANAYIEDRRPWERHRDGDAVGVAAILGDCLEALRIVALLASPVIPGAGAELWRRLGLPGTPGDQRVPAAAAWGAGPAAVAPLRKGPSLFPRVEATTDP